MNCHVGLLGMIMGDDSNNFIFYMQTIHCFESGLQFEILVWHVDVHMLTVCICSQLGLERYHGVGILGFNSVEWFIADIGAILAG